MTVRLSKVAEVVRGVSFDKGEAAPLASADSVPVLRAGNIGDDLDLTNDLVWVPTSRVSADQLLRVGDIVVCMSSGSASVVGKSARLNRAWHGSFGAFCAVLRPSGMIDSGYLAMWLRSPAFFGWRDSQARGANIQNLRASQFGELELTLPTLLEQRHIAARLMEQLAAVERARAAAMERLATTRRLERAELKRAFLGITPLAADRVRDDPPPGWRWKMLTDVARLESGHTPSRYHPEWWGGSVPWIALPDIRALDGKVAYDTIEHTNDAGIANSSARILPAGTVVLSRTASVGFVTVTGREMATSQDFVNWVCGPNLDSTFLALVLRASRECIRSLSSGAIHKTVYVPTVKRFEVCAPTVKEQRRIAAQLSAVLESAFQVRAAAEAELAAIEALPAALLREAFSSAA